MKILSQRTFLPWWLLIISLAFNLGFGSTLSVQSLKSGTSTNPAGLGRGTMSMVFVHEDLELSPAQESGIQRINENLLSKIAPQRTRMNKARAMLAGLLSESISDLAAVAAQLDQINEIQREVQQQVIDHLLQEKALLRADQIEVFDEIIRQRVCPGDGTGGFGPGRGAGDGSGQGRRDGSGRGLGQGRGRQSSENESGG